MEQLLLDDQSPVWILGSLMSRAEIRRRIKALTQRKSVKPSKTPPLPGFGQIAGCFVTWQPTTHLPQPSLCNFYEAFDKKGLGHSFVFSYR